MEKFRRGNGEEVEVIRTPLAVEVYAVCSTLFDNLSWSLDDLLQMDKKALLNAVLKAAELHEIPGSAMLDYLAQHGILEDFSRAGE
jgi:hypothetical protein